MWIKSFKSAWYDQASNTLCLIPLHASTPTIYFDETSTKLQTYKSQDEHHQIAQCVITKQSTSACLQSSERSFFSNTAPWCTTEPVATTESFSLNCKWWCQLVLTGSVFFPSTAAKQLHCVSILDLVTNKSKTMQQACQRGSDTLSSPRPVRGWYNQQMMLTRWHFIHRSATPYCNTVVYLRLWTYQGTICCHQIEHFKWSWLYWWILPLDAAMLFWKICSTRTAMLDTFWAMAWILSTSPAGWILKQKTHNHKHTHTHAKQTHMYMIKLFTGKKIWIHWTFILLQNHWNCIEMY